MRAWLLMPLLLAGCGESGPPPVRLTKVAVTLPADEEQFTGPDADLLNANCAACHSASMVINQPKLSAEQWGKTVHKMREVYKAPIAPEDEPGIVRALTALSGA